MKYTKLYRKTLDMYDALKEILPYIERPSIKDRIYPSCQENLIRLKLAHRIQNILINNEDIVIDVLK